MAASSLEPTPREIPGATSTAGTNALVLIDFQRDFLADDGRMPVARNQVPGFIAAAQRAVATARATADPIVAIGNEFRKGDWLMNLLRRGASIEGSEGAQWDPRLPLDHIHYLPKWAGSAFVNPALDQWLAANNVTRLTIAGLQAKACVTATAKDALRRGLTVSVLEDAVACVSDSSRKDALDRLRRRGVAVCSSTEWNG